MFRLFLSPVARLFYRIRASGLENVPRNGPALLVSNHVSFIDAFLVGLASPRAIRFLVFRAYYDLPIVGLFFRAMGCIPISGSDSPKALIESLRAARAALEQGSAICIFAEGEISRHGQMLRFKKGFERIVDGLDVPVVPVHLDQVWGNIFSFEGGRLLFKRPHTLPYPVTVSFGRALASTTQAFEVRQAILELGASAFARRLEQKPPLALAFYRQAKKHPLSFAIADSNGARLNYGQALVRAFLLGKALGARTSAENVGVFLPPSAGAALANLGLALMGRAAINLNYTASREIVSRCAFKAGVAEIVTSRQFIEKLGWRPEGNLLFLEDLAKAITKPQAAKAAALLLGPPAWMAERWLLRQARVPLSRTAAVIFTSGSTGEPKGVMLTHSNILSNILAISQVYQLGKGDRMMGVLPFFHAFGFTATLWLPLTTGMGAIYHYNPLDAKRVGELVASHRATFLLATPTFLLNYMRRIEAGQFKSLRYVLVGAEKLRAEAAKAFEDKFGLPPLEGYGCTELSPVAAVNIPDIDWPGIRQKGTKRDTIGHPLPGVFIKIVHPETREALPAGEAGLLLVKGPNVMKGYLGERRLTEEVIQDGYYVTGDIGLMDDDGFIAITDRLSRFSKIAGEMVPHIKIEEKLHELFGAVEQTFIVTGAPDPKRGEKLVVLFKGKVDIENLRGRLAASDLPKLWLPDRADFFPIAEFPVLGSGKLDMLALRALAKSLS